MGDHCDPHRILFELFLDHHYHHHCQCSANEGSLTWLSMYYGKTCSYNPHEHDVTKTATCLLCQFSVWEVILKISLDRDSLSSSLVFHYILGFIVSVSLLGSDIQHQIWSIRQYWFLDKPFVVYPGRVGTRQQSNSLEGPLGVGGVEEWNSWFTWIIVVVLQPRLLSLLQVK